MIYFLEARIFYSDVACNHWLFSFRNDLNRVLSYCFEAVDAQLVDESAGRQLQIKIPVIMGPSEKKAAHFSHGHRKRLLERLMKEFGSKELVLLALTGRHGCAGAAHVARAR